MWLKDGQSVFDLLGFEWSLIVLAKEECGNVSKFRHAAEALQIELTVVDLTSENAHSVYDANLVLVRPDQIVAWRGTAANVDPKTLLLGLMGYGGPDMPSKKRASSPLDKQSALNSAR